MPQRAFGGCKSYQPWEKPRLSPRGQPATQPAEDRMTPMELDLAASTLIVEQDTDVALQRVMLLPWAQSKVSFLKDLVTGSTASSTSCASTEQQRTALL